MSASFYHEAADRFRALRDRLSLHPHSKDNIRTFRTQCSVLLKELSEKVPSSETEEMTALCRLGLEIAAETAKTRVCEIRQDGCLIVRPDVCPEETRDLCASASDQIAETASGGSKMYIPPSLERTQPSPEKCMAVLRLYDMEKAKHSAQRQSSNRSINRLFGSRG